MAVAVTPDGQRAVSASEDKTLKVWDLEQRARAAHPRRPLGFGHGVAVTPDGQRAVSASGGQDAEGVGPGQRPRAAHPGRPL